MGTPYLVRTGEGRRLDLGDCAAVVLADSGATDASLSVLRTDQEPGTATPELLDEIAARHQMDVVGPVPDGCL